MKNISGFSSQPLLENPGDENGDDSKLNRSLRVRKKKHHGHQVSDTKILPSAIGVCQHVPPKKTSQKKGGCNQNFQPLKT